MSLAVHYPRNAVKNFLKNRFPETNWDWIDEELPQIIWRHRWNELAEKYGLPYRKGHIQNLDSQGVGPGTYV